MFSEVTLYIYVYYVICNIYFVFFDITIGKYKRINLNLYSNCSFRKKKQKTQVITAQRHEKVGYVSFLAN